MAWEERRGDGGIGSYLSFGEFVDCVVEIRNGHFGSRWPDESCKEDCQIFEWFVLHRLAIHSAVKIWFVGIDGYGCVDDTAHAKRQTWDMIIKPIAIGEKNEVDWTNCIVGRFNGFAEAS